jgi:hypothetical protein
LGSRNDEIGLGVVLHHHRFQHAGVGFGAPGIDGAVHGHEDELCGAGIVAIVAAVGVVDGRALHKKLQRLAGEIAGGVIDLAGDLGDAITARLERLVVP